MSSAEQRMPVCFALEREVSDAVDSYFCDEVSISDLRCQDVRYELEEAEDALDPLVLVSKSDGQRYEVEIAVYVREIPPKPDPDAPVHIEGQEEIPLSLGGAS